MQNTHMPDYKFQHGDTLHPNNDPKHAKFPEEDWCNDNFLVEVRHK